MSKLGYSSGADVRLLGYSKVVRLDVSDSVSVI